MSGRRLSRAFKVAATRQLEAGYQWSRWRAGWWSAPPCCITGSVSSSGTRQCLSQALAPALVREPDRGTRTQNRSSSRRDRPPRRTQGVLAPHRRTADAVGTDWRIAVHRNVAEEVTVGRGMSIERTVEFGRLSQASFYRFNADTKPDRGMACVRPSNALRWSGLPTVGHASRRSCGGVNGR